MLIIRNLNLISVQSWSLRPVAISFSDNHKERVNGQEEFSDSEEGS